MEIINDLDNRIAKTYFALQRFWLIELILTIGALLFTLFLIFFYLINRLYIIIIILVPLLGLYYLKQVRIREYKSFAEKLHISEEGLTLFAKNKKVNFIPWNNIISIEKQIYEHWEFKKGTIPINVYVLRYYCEGIDKFFRTRSYMLLGENAGEIIKNIFEKYKEHPRGGNYENK